jgi:ribosomal protein L37AE/L43A
MTNAFVEALRLRTPDESHRIRCPDCNAVLAEHLSGINIFQCRSCKWRGVVYRDGVSLVASFVTQRPGRDDLVNMRTVRRD